MTFEAFSARADEIFRAIPFAYKEGVDGLQVTRKTVLHPTLPEVYTLGECLSEHYPSDFGGPGEVRSRVALYYGSFLELSRSRDDWDWEEELWETITHELRHHLEHLALDDALGDLDRAADENFARREGERFDPFFFRDGRQVAPGLYEVDGDLFLEHPIDGPAGQGRVATVAYGGEQLEIRIPDDLADVHFLNVAEWSLDGSGDFHVVLVRKRGIWEWVRSVTGSRPMRVGEGEAASAARRRDDDRVRDS